MYQCGVEVWESVLGWNGAEDVGLAGSGGGGGEFAAVKNMAKRFYFVLFYVFCMNGK